MTDESWYAHVFGSGAFQWEWWADGYQNPSGDVVIKYHEDPDEPNWDNPKIHYTTLQKIADTASTLAKTESFVRNQLVNDDFDADGMDRVLQYEVFGEIIFG